jgi:pimeloyl-[acyl-carrier protein] methyl ester esterase
LRDDGSLGSGGATLFGMVDLGTTGRSSHSGPPRLELGDGERADDVPERWLLLRGLGRDARHWFRFAELLSAALEVPCQAVDLPGVGQGRFEFPQTSVEATAQVVAHRLDGQRFHSEGRCGLFGLSFGGMVALELCRQRPSWFSHAVLVNSSSRLSPPWLRMFPRGVALVTRSLLSRDPEERELRIYELTSNLGHERNREHARHAADFARSSPIRRRTVLAQLAAAARFVPPDTAQPVLVLSSKCDRMVSSSCSRDLATHLGALHLVNDRAGHDLPLDAPDWVIESLRRWLASSDARVSLGRD